jgi:hypothetical protein
MGKPEDIARRYREEFQSEEKPPRAGIKIDFMPDEDEKKRGHGFPGGMGCPGADGPWPHGCFDPPSGAPGSPGAPGSDWEDWGRMFGRMGRKFERMGRRFGRMDEASGNRDPHGGFAGGRMRDYFKGAFGFSWQGAETKELSLSYRAEALARFDFPSAALRLSACEGEEIRLRVRLRGGREGLDEWELEEKRSEASISLKERGGFRMPPFMFPFAVATEVEIQIPPSVREVEVRGFSGDIQASGLGAAFHAASASGDIFLSGMGSLASCRSSSGDMRLEGVSGDLDASTSSGNILASRAKRDIRLTSRSGDIAISAAEGDVAASSASGNISAKGIAGNAELASTSGNIAIAPRGPTQVERDYAFEYSTVSGQVRIDGEKQLKSGLKSFGNGRSRLKASTVSGNIALDPS